MTDLIHQLISQQAHSNPDNTAVCYKGENLSYAQLNDNINKAAQGFVALGLARNERIAVYLQKCHETVCSFFAISKAGGVFVPINPLLKPKQVAYILRDCNVKALVTSSSRLQTLTADLSQCHDLHSVIIADPGSTERANPDQIPGLNIINWHTLTQHKLTTASSSAIDMDMAAILYTSGSTGKPKGVVLSHRNLIAGAKSVAQYLENVEQDRILSVLPFSFDYGLSQLTTAFSVGASTVLMDYLFPRDVIKMAEKQSITGLAAVPPLWNQLAQLEWPDKVKQHLRYITNSGGSMPIATTKKLGDSLPKTSIYLMYGLTEAFRSTFLPPDEVHTRPDSMGKAIPNAEVLVVREDGSPCAAGEPGELVHRGSLVAMGYWNDEQKTRERFKPIPDQNHNLSFNEIAVWSGDTVRVDEQGYLYFISRKDDMIKTSGYRVSPTEVEEIIYQTGLIGEVACIGMPHPELGQAIVAVVTAAEHSDVDLDKLLTLCKEQLPAYMVPAKMVKYTDLPRNPNGKIDRKALAADLQGCFET